MRNLLLFEMRNIFSRKEIKIIFILLMFCCGFNFIVTCYNMYGLPESSLERSYNVFVLENPINNMFVIDTYVLLFPLIVTIIYSDCKFIEDKNNISVFIDTKINSKKLANVRFILIFFLSAIVIAIPLLFNDLLTLITFPQTSANGSGLADYLKFSYTELENLKKEGSTIGFLDYIQVYNPNYYNIVKIILKSITAGAFSVVAYAVSFYVKKSRLVVLLSSYLICLIGVYMPEISPFFDIETIYTADIYLISHYLATSLILVVVSYILVFFKIKKGLICK